MEQIKKIKDHCIKTEPNIYNMRTFILVNLSFYNFLRLQRGIKYKGIRHRFSTFIYENIEKSKSDMYRNGNWIYIARVNSELYPVATL